MKKFIHRRLKYAFEIVNFSIVVNAEFMTLNVEFWNYFRIFDFSHRF